MKAPFISRNRDRRHTPTEDWTFPAIPDLALSLLVFLASGPMAYDAANKNHPSEA